MGVASIVLVVVWMHLLRNCECVKVKSTEVDNFEEDYTLSAEWPSSSGATFGYNWSSMFPFMKTKRAAYGLLQLATKRPHKTAAELQHLPPQDSFMSVRGRKRSFPISEGTRRMLDILRYFDSKQLPAAIS